MTTKDITAEELVAVLKFTPRTYHISMWGYGGERVMGRVSQAEWDYCMDNQVDIGEIAWDSDAADYLGIDDDKLPFPPGSWYECDNIAHVSGVSLDSGTLQIEDELNMTILEKDLEDFNDDESPEFACIDVAYISQFKKGDILFIGSSSEKGTFFEGDIELTAPFDITKLTLHSESVDGEEIVSGVSYDGEEIENYGGGTDGKSSNFTMVRLIDDKGTFESYEPGEKDWGHPPCGPSPCLGEQSPEFDFNDYKPVYVGYYSCAWSCFGTNYGTLYWDGETFGQWEHGKFDPIETVYTWQGYNRDTTK
jgi:hypothetical protein